MATKSGYQNVYVYRGGLPEWIKAGYPTETTEVLPKVDVPSVSVQELKTLLDSDQDLVLLDTRRKGDAAKYWINNPKRVHMSMHDLSLEFAELPMDKKLFILDKGGKRGGLISRFLASRGFKDLTLVTGGMKQWVKQGLPTEIAK